MTRVQHFYDQVTSTFSYVVSDAETVVAAIIDPVLDLDYASGTLGTRSADESIEHVRDNNYSLRTSSKPTFTPTISPARPTFVSNSVERL